MGRTLQVVIILFLYVAFGQPKLKAQIYNYWDLGSNTSSSLLAGAVVGGGGGITSIFYNPAGIRDIEQNKIALNASLFNFNWHLYKHALSANSSLDYLEWMVKPRFLSYQYKLKSIDNLYIQFVVFNRNQQLLELYDQRTIPVKSQTGNIDLNYTANFDLDKRYSDYWIGAGAAYDINSRLSVGLSLFGSGKTMRYYQNRSILVMDPTDSLKKSSSWESQEKQYFYVVSLIAKIGVRYRFDNVSIGMNVSLPSMRLWGDGYSKRSIQYSNIVYEGQLQDDYLQNQYNNHIVANLKEPFSVSAGIMFDNKERKSKYYASFEYFAKVNTYKMLDNTRVAVWYEDEYSPGDDFLSYKFGGKQLFNVAIGYRQNIKEGFSYMLGFRTDFASYEVSDEGKWKDMGEYLNIGNSLYHFSGGIEFRFHANTILLGTEYVFGMTNDATQFANYNYPGIFDKNQHIALQDYPQDIMQYQFHGLGLYLGYSFDF